MAVAENHHSDSNRARRAARAASPWLLLALLSAGFYWKLALTRQYTWLDRPDLAYQVLPWFEFQAREWHQGRFPLWDPNHWGGQSLIGQAQPGAAFPFNWALFWLPLRVGHIRHGFLTWYFIGERFLAALFCFWLLRDLKRSRAASLLGGALFGLSAWFGKVTWPQMVNGAIVAPLIFLFLIARRARTKAVVERRAFGRLSRALRLSGHHQVPIFLTLACAGVWLCSRKLRLAAVAFTFTFLAGALQILPAYEYGKLAVRWAGAPEALRWNEPVPYSVHAEYSLGASSLLGILVPGIQRHTTAFVGVTAAVLAVVAVAFGWRRQPVRLFALIALGGLLFSLGRNNFLHGVLYAVVPLVEKARTPAMAIFLFHFGVAVLAAYGLDSLRRARESAGLRRLVWVLALAGAAGYLVTLALQLAKVSFDDAIVLSCAIALLLAALVAGFALRKLSLRALAVSMLGLALIELGNASDDTFTERARATHWNKWNQHADVAAFLRAQPGPFRIEVDGQDIPYNFGDWFNFEEFGGYFASLPENMIRLGVLTPHRRALYGVAYQVTRKPGQQPVYESPSGLKVYRLPDAYPRVWSIHEAAAPLETQLPAVEHCAGQDRVRLASQSSNRVVIHAEMQCKGLVVLSDNWFPGWRATIDGARTEILPAYVSLRGVVVPAGRHRIEMRYRPMSVYAGALLSALGFLGAAGLAVWERTRMLSSKTT